MLALLMTSQASSSLSRSSAFWTNLARSLQVILICLTVGLFIISIPANYDQRSTVCRTEPCPPGQLTARSEDALTQSGFSVEAFVKLTIALDILIAVVFTVSAVIIFIRKPFDSFAIFVTLMLTTFGMATFTGGLQGAGSLYPSLHWLTETLAVFGNIAIVAFLYIFPNGRFTPRWTITLLAIWILFQLPRYFLPNSPLNLAVSSPLLYNILFPIGILSGIGTQIYRYRSVSNTIERQQTKWVIYGLALGITCYLVVRILSVFVPDPYGSGILIDIILNILAVLFILLVPISITIAVIRYRLWDINPVINRTLVYGTLSALTIGIYVLAVGYFASLFRNSNANYIISFVATGIIAILFEPIRERLQRTVNRLMYGERDDPATVLTNLSQRLDSAIAPASVLQTIVETLAQTLRLPYAGIILYHSDDEHHLASSYGNPPSELTHLPLTYQAEQVGELVLAPRSLGESFSPADMKLINIIAQQAGVAVYTVSLNRDLQASRERLVTAQEEERRRLRRDLHDGVGPTLASLSQRLDTAADLVDSNPQASIEMLHELKGQVKETVAEIRRLVYALRPPVLDEFGLVSAIREHVAQYSGPKGLQITFDTIDPLPSLPAAVEVAAYRIALEAFTNIINHAEATSCNIKIKIEDNSLLLEVCDNGKGLSNNMRSGVGLTSMRERVAELRGEFSIDDNTSAGTCVYARLPISKE